VPSSEIFPQKDGTAADLLWEMLRRSQETGAMTADESAELDRLLSTLCDGRLSADEVARLEVLLETAAARRRYLEYMDLHGRLLTRPQKDRPVEVRPAPAGRFRWQPYLIGAAAAVCLTIGLQNLLSLSAPPTPEGPTRPGPPRYVATLARADRCEWEGPGPVLGGRIAPGVLRLKSGTAQLAFDGGAFLILESGSALRVESRQAATVLAGRVVFRGDDNPESFDLRTPRSVLQDFGTEYAVSVSPAGEEIHVFDGEVRRWFGKTEVQLNAGQALCFRRGGPARGEPMPLDPEGFTRSIRPAPPPVNPRDGLTVFDGLDYPPEIDTDLSQAAAGFGWVGPWKRVLARPADPALQPVRLFEAHEGFTFTGFAKAVRRLAQPLRMDVDAIHYLSFRIRRGGPDPEPPNAVAILFRTTPELEADMKTGNADLVQRLNIGIDRNSEVFTYLNRVGSRQPLPLIFGQTYRIVAKIVTSQDLPDQVFVRVYGPDETVDWDEPTAWSLVGPQVFSDLVFDWLQVHINSKAKQAIDDVRLGATWASVAHPWIDRQ
jgi:hypothetical protein